VESIKLTKGELFDIMTGFREDRAAQSPKKMLKVISNHADHIIHLSRKYQNDKSEIKKWYMEWNEEVNQKLFKEETR
tara:strand:- start:576 stop:806 length:231 start_codon:yes stop_codon:yes gene_type:complete